MQTDGRQEPARSPHHLVPSAHFDALAAGRGDAGTVRFLRTTEYSRRLLLLRALLDAVAETPGALGPLPGVDSVWDTLTAAQERSPEVFGELLLHPQVGVWLGHGLRRLRRTAWGDGPLWTDLGHVFTVCAVAALRTGLPLRTTVPLRDGGVMFPTLGLARLPDRPRWGTAEVLVAAGRLRVDPYGARLGPPDPPHLAPGRPGLPGPPGQPGQPGRVGRLDRPGRLDSPRPLAPLDPPDPSGLPGLPEGDPPGWQGTHRLHAHVAGRPVGVWLDDIDPYRDLSEPLPAHRLSPEETDRWRERFDLALGVLEDSDPETAAALAEGLRSVTPVRTSSTGSVLSASSGDAFGGVLTSLPPDPVTFAVTLVHEFQHTKLGALLHLLTLEQDDGAERHHAPWRDDPRPLSGLLQGAYAFLGITDFWSRRLDRAPAAERASAEFEFALGLRQTREAVETLGADPALTAHGRRFVRGMAARLTAWTADRRVRPGIDAMAGFAATDHRTEWRIRHLVPAPDAVRALARAYVTGAAADLRGSGSTVVPDLTARWSHARTRLIRQVLGTPEPGTPPSGPSTAPPAPSAAERALVAGDPAAADGYARLLAEDPEDPDAWTGLVLALALAEPSARPLLRRPELPRAVHRELRVIGTTADPRRLARWLAAGIAGPPDGTRRPGA
ncbi:HEXXH motif-containing putative peptide modification protein [Streptomyces narbonensis]|uniref:HEXXH motif-containing putative peptide modification protein n=1 Tax=Streptomyces narbonensis TaxID=67333 RepID=A0ABV3C1G0_9ACTN